MRARHRALLALLAAALGAGCARERPAAVVRSGDEVLLVRAVKGHELVVRKGAAWAKLRLVGIYTLDPSAQQKREITVYATRAVELVERYAGRPLHVVLEREQPDPRGRYLAFVEVDGVDVGKRLVEEGLAAVYTEFPFSRESDYFAAEAVARTDARGLWGAPASRQRISALRQTWGSVRLREHGSSANDPLLAAGGER